MHIMYRARITAQAVLAPGPEAVNAAARLGVSAYNTSEPMKVFIGSLASATARPQLS